MDEMNYRGQATSWWISSLAISVVCCAILFVVFAGYVFDLKETVAMLRMRIELTDQRFADVNAEVETLRHRMAVQQIQVLPAPGAAPVQLPVSTVPAVAAPSAAAPAPGIVVPGVTPPPAPAAPAKP